MDIIRNPNNTISPTSVYCDGETIEPPFGHIEEVQLHEGDGLLITAEATHFNFKCCDCGLIHRIETVHTTEGIILKFYRSA